MLDSVRARLTVWYSIALGIVLIFLAVLTYLIYQRNITQRTETNLAELASAFTTTFESELPDQTGMEGVKEAALEAMKEHRFRDTIFVVLNSAGNVVISSLELPSADPTHERITEEIFSSPEFREATENGKTEGIVRRKLPGGKDGFHAFTSTLTAGDKSYKLVLLQSLHSQEELLLDIRNTFLLVIPISLLLAGAGGYFLARKSLAPVAAMASQARKMGAANLGARLEVANQRDELGQLALTFNQLLDRLEDSFEKQRRFIADASHELRTPVAILRGETEVTLSRPSRSPEEYRETLGVLRDESQRLAGIIEDLFTLTRADAGEYPLSHKELYLDELATDSLRRARTLAMAKNITLASEIVPELPLRADEALLRRMLLNLLDNAIKYTPEGGNISLACAKQENGYIVSVTDTGEGIPKEMQGRVFERFFRVDQARSREGGAHGGAGLGLSIARWIAEAHHGRLELTRSDATGSTFSVILPITGPSGI
ncbi:MAG TPA: ATP-binding protein [Candidatus Acidoferrum sp.]|nr:ATP-binding protein [Candidatus Acidoferrum sp.]